MDKDDDDLFDRVQGKGFSDAIKGLGAPRRAVPQQEDGKPVWRAHPDKRFEVDQFGNLRTKGYN